MNNAIEELGKLVLRLTVGVLMLFHGIGKLQGGTAGIVGMVERAGLPGPLGYLVLVGEVLAPVLAIVGLWTRPAALVMMVNMAFAVGLAHMHELTAISGTGGWALELQGFYFFGALAVAFLGAGRFSLGGAHGRFN